MSTAPISESAARLSAELGLPKASVAAVLGLLADGNSVPFIARYRKEATGSLDEVQIRDIAERHAYLGELEQRRAAILAAIAEQGQLDDALRARIEAAATKAELEDVYLPFRPKRRTRARLARERGLGPLAERILAQPEEGDPLAEATRLVDAERGVPDAEAALTGARDIVAELSAERPEARALVRQAFAQGLLKVEARPGARERPTKFEAYYDHAEPVAAIPSHRYLAIRRGEREEVLRAWIEVDPAALVERLVALAGLRPGSPFAGLLGEAVADGYSRLLAPSVERDLRAELKERSDRAAVEVFADNLRDLLMAPPLGPRPVLGVDPGLRTGCKLAALDPTGKLVATATVQLSRSDAERQRAGQLILELVRDHRPAALAVGNGTGGREAEAFLRGLLAEAGLAEPPMVVQVNEAGASVYSASDLARQEFPEHDVTLRGAISIGRRLQDPLAELVKIEPRAIGVGQYQHDVHQPLLVRKLDEVVESCVHRVGVELNLASAPLLARVAGIGPKLAGRIVAWREAHGAFATRRGLLDVPGLGARAFEQAAGFLRIRDGQQPLDASAVHPERYALVGRMAAELGVELRELVGAADLAARIDPARYLSAEVGEPTLRDILAELARPGRDPRRSFEPVRFRDDVRSIEDLSPGMQLEGVVTNVTRFGAFVDVGVHRDGLVHISQLADAFVDDPRQVVRVGDRIRVRVLEVDLERGRISLTARSQVEAGAAKPKKPPKTARERKRPEPKKVERPAGGGQAGELRHNPFAGVLKRR